MWNYAKAPDDVLKKAKALSAVADAFSVPLAAAALQFPLGNEIVTSVIPGPRDKAELQQIVDWFATSIPSEFWAALKSTGLINGTAPVPS
jgi:D-threo-aldose 1-dehydrogenase